MEVGYGEPANPDVMLLGLYAQAAALATAYLASKQADDEPDEDVGVVSGSNVSGAASRGTSGASISPADDTEAGEEGKPPEPKRRKPAATPASRSLSARSAGSDRATQGRVPGVSSSRLRKGAQDKQASGGNRVCEEHIHMFLPPAQG